MSKVVFVPAVAACEKVVIIRPAVPAKVMLELTEHEAQTILALAGRCNGGHLTAVYLGLGDALSHTNTSPYAQWVNAALNDRTINLASRDAPIMLRV